MKFEDLEVWRRSARLSADLFTYFAKSRNFVFRDQITKSGLSIASNIAEGCERASDREFARFLKIAKGSCGELRTQVYVGIEAGCIDSEQGHVWLDECRQISRMLYAFIGNLAPHAARPRSQDEPA